MTVEGPDLQLEVRDGLATLSFDRPDSKVNLLTRSAMLALDGILATLEESIAAGQSRALLIRSAKPGNFIAGADIDELAALDDAATATEVSRRGQGILMRLERLGIPTLAAIRGTCVGGGLELALACKYRVASDEASTRLGLPETRLGILPGLGGTVRLPLLIGLQPALDLILSGQQVKATRARRLGLVDRVLEAASFDEEVARLAAELVAGRRPLRRRERSALQRWLKDGAAARWLIRQLTRRAVMARSKGHYPALPAALDVTVSGLGLTSPRAHEREARAFGRLAVKPECKNLIHVFKLTEGARKRAPAGSASEVERAAVVGAGVMGAGIAELFAYQEISVQVLDIDEARVQVGLQRARDLLEKAGQRSGWSGEELETRLGCLVGTTGYAGFAPVDLVLEAVLEKMEVKRDVLAHIEDHVRPTAVLATNTSALSITELQERLRHPERLCGLHFFNPPHRMPLVEVVRGARTSDDALATAFALALRLGKTPVLVQDSPGFVVNRVLAAYLTEVGHLLDSGMGVRDIDRTMSSFGMPMGPLRLLDEIGLDVVAEVSQTMLASFGDRFAPAPIMKRVLATGVTGRKGGRGFYRYADSKARGTDPQIEQLLRESTGAEPPDRAQAEERMVLCMINEAARALDESVVDSPESLDVAMIMGTGFPPFRGGLLRYADSIGLEYVRERLRHYQRAAGPRFAPAQGLERRSAFFSA